MVRIGNYEVNTDFLYWDNYIFIERITDTELRIGLTDYGQAMLKDITAVDMPSKGQRLHKKSVIFTIESISRDLAVKSPVSCIVLNINEEVNLSPELLNEGPFENWIVHVDCLELKDLDLLISGEDMADIILEETGASVSDSEDDEEDDEFDYENEFSIDSRDDYYNNDEYSENYDDFDDDDDDYY
ncbi:MAG: glycine cleavage system protein H [Candidatus Heimdallarchaeota archaeon]|nr:glycine cleavage system protein H [Candidatus Heimdallarchaeota archaeon]